MAINPLLLNVKPISEITTVDNPTDGHLLFYDGSDELKKVDIIEFQSLIGGIAKPLAITDASPTVSGWYKPTTSGTYANAGGLVAQVGYDTLFYFDGTTWSKVEVDMPKGADGKTTETWTPKAFVSGSTTYYLNSIWEATSNTISTDIPGTSTKWVFKVGVNDVFDVTENKKAPTNKAISDFIFDNTATETTQANITVSETSYGGTTIVGWGFSIGKPKNLKAVIVKLKNIDSTTITRLKFVIKKLNSAGNVIENRTVTDLGYATGTTFEYRFDLTTVFNNSENENVWIEVYSDQTIQIFRNTTNVVYKWVDGYYQPAFSTVKDFGTTTVANGYNQVDNNFDVYHRVVLQTFDSRFKESLFPADLQKPKTVFSPTDNVAAATMKATFDYLFDSSLLNKEVSFIPETSTTYGASTIVGWGFPIGVQKKLTGIVFKFRNDGTAPITSFKIVVKRTNQNGIVLSNQTVTGLNFLTATTYEYSYLLPSKIDNDEGDKLWVEIYTDQTLTVFRNNAQVYTLPTYPMVLYSVAKDFGVTVVSRITEGTFDIYHRVILEDIDAKVKEDFLPINISSTNDISNENERISFVGSSVTWGDGYLQSGFVKKIIEKYQRSAEVFTPTTGVQLTNRKYFGGVARKFTLNDEISFDSTGNELTIVQSIERINTNASEIELYVDGTLYDTFNNFNNSDIGTTTKNFSGNGIALMFDLGKAFTYGHTVMVNGVSKSVTHCITQSAGFTIPSGNDCAIIRKIGTREDGTVNVTHWLWFKTAPANGDSISVSFNYGEEINYEKSTIGKDAVGNNECPYGDGSVSFDTTNPSTMSSGLDFRQTDSRAFKTWRFKDTKKRTFKLKVKGLFGDATGTPYFIFNFATNRIFHFQNAGIGGWKVSLLNQLYSADRTRNWQGIAKFNPNKIVLESTPNDDWESMDYRISTSKTVTLSELQSIKNMPLKSIVYNSGANNYTIERYKGLITAITETSVTFSGTSESTIIAGDLIQIGQYFSNNHDSVERVVSSVSGNTVYFLNPINKNEIIYPNISDFVGKEICIRSLASFKTILSTLIDNIQTTTPSVDIFLLENPMPSVLARELWGYWYVMDSLEKEKRNVFSINYDSLRTWQKSQQMTKVTVDLSTASNDTVLGKNVKTFGTAGQNLIYTDVLQNGKSVYGKIVVENGLAYTVDSTLSGAALNKTSAESKSTRQKNNLKPPRVIQLDNSITGSVDVVYPAVVWSADSTHLNNGIGEEIYSDFILNEIKWKK